MPIVKATTKPTKPTGNLGSPECFLLTLCCLFSVVDPRNKGKKTGDEFKFDGSELCRLNTGPRGSPFFSGNKKDPSTLAVQVRVAQKGEPAVFITVPLKKMKSEIRDRIREEVSKNASPETVQEFQRIYDEALQCIGASAPDTVEAGGGAAETTEEVAKTTAAATELPTHA